MRRRYYAACVWFLAALAALFAGVGITSPPLEPRLTRNLEAAREHTRQGIFMKAYTHYRKALALNGGNAEAAYGVKKLRAFLNFDRIPKSERVEWIKKEFPRYESDPDLTLMIAKLHYRYERHSRSRLFVRKTLELSPDYAEAWYMLGVLASRAEGHGSATQYFARASEQAPDNDMYQWRLALSLFRGGEEQDARKELEKALARSGNHEDYLEFVIQLIKEGDLPEANLFQAVLMENLENYLGHEPEDAVWCLFSRENNICLREDEAKIAFSQLLYLMILLLQGNASDASALEEEVEGDCGEYAEIDLVRTALLGFSSRHLHDDIYAQMRLQSVKDGLTALCR